MVRELARIEAKIQNKRVLMSEMSSPKAMGRKKMS